MIRSVAIPAAVVTFGICLLCVASVTCRADGLPIVAGVEAVADSGEIIPVEGRRRKPPTPEEQARKDHLREQRAARWGIFTHYLLGGLSVGSGINPLSWVTGTVSSLFGFAWSVGMDLLMLVLIGLLLFGLAMLAGLYGTYRFIRWLFSRSK